MRKADLVDPTFNALYAKLHGARPYGTSGIEFLPEAVLYFLNSVASGTITIHPDQPATILDYGCGQSSMGRGLEVVLTPVVSAIQDNLVEPTDIRALFGLAAQTLDDALHNKDFILSNVMPTPSVLKISRYDPAIPAYSTFPRGTFDYVVCTDVVEHLPDTVRAGHNVSVLKANLIQLAALSPSVYINASCRDAVSTLSNGQSAHCTLKTPGEWKARLTNTFPARLTPVFSRDLTSCSFATGPLLDDTKRIAYDFVDTFGGIDLIPFPPKKDMTPEKRARLEALQPHKKEVVTGVVAYWLEQDPEKTAHSTLRRMTQDLRP